eukprot:Rhum_TRINITY_DN14598_c7_g1::Rhum_TRINITY_DN14598_c7_g1_i1::g.100856::m.100856
MAQKDTEMFVGKATDENVDYEQEMKGRDRVTDSGMNRDRTVKHAVADDHDFAQAKAGLGGKAAPKTDEEKVAAAAAARAQGSGAPTFTNQLTVSKKEPEKNVDYEQE